MTLVDCLHCSSESLALRYPLKLGKVFRIVCDSHPLIEGHILLIPIDHVLCMGCVTEGQWQELVCSYSEIRRFILSIYGPCAVFEHGVTGQTVSHAHMHFLPFRGGLEDIVPEKDRVVPVRSFADLKEIYARNQRYLFLEVQEQLFSVETSLGKPRFFRDRFAGALGMPQRGNWQVSVIEPGLSMAFMQDIVGLQENWSRWASDKNVSPAEVALGSSVGIPSTAGQESLYA